MKRLRRYFARNSVLLQSLLCAMFFGCWGILLAKDFNFSAPEAFACFALASGVSNAFLYFFLKRRNLRYLHKFTAVMSEMRGGDLKARFPHAGRDEWSPLVNAFNEMAERSESLVYKIKRAERSRSRWLQELAHDLRVPLSSLDISLELLQSAGENLRAEDKTNVLTTSQAEVAYLKNVLEDLLLLGLMEDIEYFSTNETVNLTVVVDKVFENFAERVNGAKKSVQLSLPEDDFLVLVNEKLLVRLLRNSFDNALFYARSSIKVECFAKASGEVVLRVANDCRSRLSAEAVAQFGIKRKQRAEDPASERRVPSLGLGSVIIREIAQKFDAQFKFQDFADDGEPWVALEITFPSVRVLREKMVA